MACSELKKGRNIICSPSRGRFLQSAVLVNRSDVKNKLIITGKDVNGIYVFNHRVLFSLYEGRKGFRFTANDNCNEIFGSFDKSEIENKPQYSHTVNIVVKGFDEELMNILKQLDNGDVFAGLRFSDGSVKIFGFDYGLSTSSYGYDPHNNEGGGVITLKSESDALEDEPPYTYFGDSKDFDNDFGGITFNPNGEFNNDFNADFNNKYN